MPQQPRLFSCGDFCLGSAFLSSQGLTDSRRGTQNAPAGPGENLPQEGWVWCVRRQLGQEGHSECDRRDYQVPVHQLPVAGSSAAGLSSVGLGGARAFLYETAPDESKSEAFAAWLSWCWIAPLSPPWAVSLSPPPISLLQVTHVKPRKRRVKSQGDSLRK